MTSTLTRVAEAPAAVAVPSSRLRILIVDDHTTFVELLAGALEREDDLCCVGTANTVASAVERFDELHPDVVVMDYHLLDGSGLTAAALILAHARATRVVMLTGYPTPEGLEQAAALGICAFLPKDGSLGTLINTLRHAQFGGMVIHQSLFLQIGARNRAQEKPMPALTPRELEVLRLMSEGKDVRANAKALAIAENTCRGYVKAILAKLGAHSQLEAVVTATRLGLITARTHE